MDLTPNQRTILLTLTTKWETPIQIEERLPKDWGNVSSVNQSLKDFLREGLVQANPTVPGLYRLTTDGTTLKESVSGDNE